MRQCSNIKILGPKLKANSYSDVAKYIITEAEIKYEERDNCMQVAL